MDIWLWLFGEGTDLTILQMFMRSVAIFCIALLLVRISGRRSFGLHSPFDGCMTVLLGAILSRAVVGASPFWATVAGAIALAAMHRLVGSIAARSEWFEQFVSGSTVLLYSERRFHKDAMRRAQISEYDIVEAARTLVQTEDLSRIDRAILERNGNISLTVKRCEGVDK